MLLDHYYFRKGQLKGQKYRRDKIPNELFSKGQKKLEEEKNSSSTQAKGERREKNSLTTQESFWHE